MAGVVVLMHRWPACGDLSAAAQPDVAESAARRHLGNNVRRGACERASLHPRWRRRVRSCRHARPIQIPHHGVVRPALDLDPRAGGRRRVTYAATGLSGSLAVTVALMVGDLPAIPGIAARHNRAGGKRRPLQGAGSAPRRYPLRARKQDHPAIRSHWTSSRCCSRAWLRFCRCSPGTHWKWGLQPGSAAFGAGRCRHAHRAGLCLGADCARRRTLLVVQYSASARLTLVVGLRKACGCVNGDAVRHRRLQ